MKYFANALAKSYEGHTYTKDPREGKFRISGIVSPCEIKIVFDNLLSYEPDKYLRSIDRSTNNQPDVFKILDPDLWLIHVFDYNVVEFYNLAKKAKRIKDDLARGKLPPRILPTPEEEEGGATWSWMCKNQRMKCQYFDLCWTQNEVKSLMELELLMGVSEGDNTKEE